VVGTVATLRRGGAGGSTSQLTLPRRPSAGKVSMARSRKSTVTSATSQPKRLLTTAVETKFQSDSGKATLQAREHSDFLKDKLSQHHGAAYWVSVQRVAVARHCAPL
jgi:hypothetical protein